MSKYKITNIDSVKGHVTFESQRDNGTVIKTDTRGDLPLDDKVALDAILSAYANAVEADVTSVKTVAPEITAMVGVAQTSKTKVQLEAKA